MALQNVEYKLLVIPIAFIILRVWTCILGILFVYAGMTPKQVSKWVTPLMILSVCYQFSYDNPNNPIDSNMNMEVLWFMVDFF